MITPNKPLTKLPCHDNINCLEPVMTHRCHLYYKPSKPTIKTRLRKVNLGNLYSEKVPGSKCINAFILIP